MSVLRQWSLWPCKKMQRKIHWNTRISWLTVFSSFPSQMLKTYNNFIPFRTASNRDRLIAATIQDQNKNSLRTPLHSSPKVQTKISISTLTINGPGTFLINIRYNLATCLMFQYLMTWDGNFCSTILPQFKNFLSTHCMSKCSDNIDHNMKETIINKVTYCILLFLWWS